jgi:hypothetical protein
MLIDLKNCEVFFTDGTRIPGAVNLMAGYTVGATAVAVDGVTGIIPVGARLSFANHDTEYKVISTTETLGNTSNIVFSPALTSAVPDNTAIIAGPIFIKMKIGDGNITWNETKNREYKLDRGLISEVRNGDEAPMDVSFQMMYEELTASDPNTDPPTPEDVLKRRGAAATWVSSDNANAESRCRPYSINIEIIHTPPCTDLKVEKVTLQYYRYEKLDHDPKDGKISSSGKCNAPEALVTKLTQAA